MMYPDKFTWHCLHNRAAPIGFEGLPVYIHVDYLVKIERVPPSTNYEYTLNIFNSVALYT